MSEIIIIAQTFGTLTLLCFMEVRNSYFVVNNTKQHSILNLFSASLT